MSGEGPFIIVDRPPPAALERPSPVRGLSKDLHDVLGLSHGRSPKFVRRFADLHAAAVAGIDAFRRAVENGSFPNEDESYHLSDEVAQALRDL